MISIQWLGAAGFKIEAGQKTFLLDPHVSDVSGSTGKRSPIDLSEDKVHLVLVTHGHADHVGNLPQVVGQSLADVVCNEVVAIKLMQRGVPRDRIILAHDGTRCFHRDYRLEVFRASHAPFEIVEALRSLWRIRRQALQAIRKMRENPAGIAVSFRISFFCGCRIQHFGSLGTTASELNRMKETGPVDVLLLPLQRHRGWLHRAAEHVRALSPRILIPHHHDDPMPPFTQAVDIRPALRALGEAYPETRIVKLSVMEVLKLSSW